MLALCEAGPRVLCEELFLTSLLTHTSRSQSRSRKHKQYTSQREKRKAATNASENGSANNRFQMRGAADNTSSKEKREAANNIVKSGKPLTTQDCTTIQYAAMSHSHVFSYGVCA